MKCLAIMIQNTDNNTDRQIGRQNLTILSAYLSVCHTISIQCLHTMLTSKNDK